MSTEMRLNRYGSIATEIYDIDKPVGALPDTAFYLSRLKNIAGPVLEPAVGTGRAMLPLLEAGLDVSGFDLSEEMLGACRTRCAAAGFSPDLTCKSFTDFTYERSFEAIFIPVGSIGLLGDFADAQNCLERCFNHLKPEGRILFDVQTLVNLAPGPDDRRSWTNASGELLTLEGIRVKTDALRQQVYRTYRYERWRDHQLVESQIDQMVLRYWGHEEMRLLVEKIGFQMTEIVGDFRPDRPLSAATRTLTFHAQRPR